jgi:N,N'-diacetylbacillosaminyl-diphospho-undecaprenol alpha-1,3-N-acetylgalactosaminyltransferase
MKVALVVTDSHSAWHFRRGLIKGLLQKGLEVYIITPTGPYITKLKGLGVKHIPVKVSRFLNPLGDLRFFIDLYRTFRIERFDVVHNFSIKPNIYGAVAARLAGRGRIYASVTGLGHVFTREQRMGSKSALGFFVRQLYKVGFRYTDRIWFQNNDDIEVFESAGIKVREKAVVIKSSGVDTDEFSPKAVNREALASIRRELAPNSARIVTMVARPLWSKGIREFVEASELLQDSESGALFIVVGEKEHGNPDNVPDEYIRKKESERLRFIGWKDNIREIFAASSIVALPSYREGTPKSSIEAMAMGKPLVTTDTVGCRETVENGMNGYLVPVGDSRALADAISRLVRNRKLLKKFGVYSRKKAEKEFDEKIIINRIIKELYQINYS